MNDNRTDQAEPIGAEGVARSGPITVEEMAELFGGSVPIKAVRFLWNSPADWNVNQVRAEVHRIAATRTPDPKAAGVEREAIAALVEELQALLDKSEGQYSKLPWRVIPSDGKPIIAGTKNGGNLFRGYIATWSEADLACAAVNALPALLAALRAVDAAPEPCCCIISERSGDIIGGPCPSCLAATPTAAPAPNVQARHNEANARALKAALMRLGGTIGSSVRLRENEAEQIVALAVQHLVDPPSEGLGK